VIGDMPGNDWVLDPPPPPGFDGISFHRSLKPSLLAGPQPAIFCLAVSDGFSVGKTPPHPLKYFNADVWGGRASRKR
jgi:hypothetical protein